ncbi:ABC transporter permease [Schumannella sp. 10F1B-5-1]|uniref:ABC transporter permease n=1 Tax=Schumannella sp. 10F1B-5-1 TaxID=2590780 RepID=UPI001130E79B|nr:ABC transporter permease subunit [Schumannella sp. 10F1B-5-1]TPW73066.1 ABC transporter permease subunit [Schumannella sp. 10F1B-5-1]
MSAPRFSAEPARATSVVILVLAAVLFLLPIVAMLEFSFRQGQRIDGVQNYGLQHWQGIFDPANSFKYQDLFEGIGNSLLICVLTVVIVLVLLLPVMILVELRYPRLRRVLEFVCIIPITIPAIVLVVGYVPVYSVVAQIFGSVPWTIAFAAGIIVLPYAYRPIAANMAGVEMTVLSEASRSLGAGWGRTLLTVILPNLRRGILSSCFITIAVVLGEYTIAAFLSQNTFQTALVLINHTDSYVSVIFAVLALLFGFVLLLVIGRVGAVGTRRERRTRRTA